MAKNDPRLREQNFIGSHSESILYGMLGGLVSGNAYGASDPPVAVNPRQVASLRASGASWRDISERLGVGVGTACRALQSPSKNPPESTLVTA